LWERPMLTFRESARRRRTGRPSRWPISPALRDRHSSKEAVTGSPGGMSKCGWPLRGGARPYPTDSSMSARAAEIAPSLATPAEIGIARSVRQELAIVARRSFSQRFTSTGSSRETQAIISETRFGLASPSELARQDRATFKGAALSWHARHVPGTPPCSYPERRGKPTLPQSHSSDGHESSYRCHGRSGIVPLRSSR
jgi:hypothetical protein